MPTGKLNLKWVAARITEKQLAELAELVKRRSDPRRTRLEAKRGKLADAIAKLDAEIAALTGEAKPGKPSAKKPGRKPGKRAVSRPKAVKAAKPAKAKPSVDADARRAKLLENLAKARAVRAANRAMAK